MKILVMGGTRYFGKKLVLKLLNEGHDITILTRGTTRDVFGNSVKRLTVNRHSSEEMKGALTDSGYDIIYDHICYHPDHARIVCDIFNNKPVKYIFISSAYIYTPSEFPLKEESFDFRQIKLSETLDNLNYAEGKRCSEAFFFDTARFGVISVRFPIVMDSDDYTNRFSFHINRILKEMPNYIHLKSGRMNFISSSIAADFLSFIKDTDFYGPVNAASKESFNEREIIKEFECQLHKQAIIRTEEDNQDIPEEEFSPFYTKGSLVLDISFAKSLGFIFRSFHDWFPEEVGNCLKMKC
jgi:nucleoside-diphosphate-sugar epimerase